MKEHMEFIEKITTMTGTSFESIMKLYKESGLSKHSEVRR